MTLNRIISFKKQDTDFHTNFFEIKKPTLIKRLTFKTYLSWLYRSTMPLAQKLILVDCTYTETAIIEAILILKKHYSISQIKRRNQELETYLKQRMDSS